MTEIIADQFLLAFEVLNTIGNVSNNSCPHCLCSWSTRCTGQCVTGCLVSANCWTTCSWTKCTSWVPLLAVSSPRSLRSPHRPVPASILLYFATASPTRPSSPTPKPPCCKLAGRTRIVAGSSLQHLFLRCCSSARGCRE